MPNLFSEPPVHCCPIHNTTVGEILGSVPLAADGKDGIGDSYAAMVAWRPDLQLRMCNICGILYATKRPYINIKEKK